MPAIKREDERGLAVPIMALQPPTLLLDLMGVWASITGVFGFIRKAAAICLFYRSRKVNILIRGSP